MKCLLVVSALFPPVGGVGVFRITKFVKYLPEFGWRSVVLTLAPDLHARRDEGFLDDLPADLDVRHTGVAGWVPFQALEKKWLPVLLPAADRLAREVRPDAVMITGPPFYPTLVGPRLYRRRQVPYLIDMRDAWHLDPYQTPAGTAGRFDHLLSGLCEPRVLAHARYLLCASPHTVEDYRARYGGRMEHAAGIVYLPNGFDPPDFEDLAPVVPQRFRMVYAGKLAVGRRTDTFLAALAAWAHSGQPGAADFEFVHVGEDNPGLHRAVDAAGLADRFHCTGYLPYRACLRWCRGADLLVIFSSGVKHEPTTKIFDYIGCRRPILVLGGAEGILAAYCREFASPALRWVSHEEADGILQALQDFHSRHVQLRGQDVVYNPEAERRYHRRELTRTLAGYLNEAAGGDLQRAVADR